MKKISFSIVFFIFLNIDLSSHIDHYKSFSVLEYELFRNNKLIGFHNYTFSRDQNQLNVKSEVEFKITKLGVDLYKYKAESEEKYKDGKFFSFTSNTNQNKKIKYVKILKKDANTLTIDGSSYQGDTSVDNIIGTWWNHEIVKAKAQISAISGRIIEQKVTFIGKETIKIGNKNFKTLRFNFSSSDETLPDSKKLNTDVWYDEKTFLWVKAAFDKTGYWEYRIKNYK